MTQGEDRLTSQLASLQQTASLKRLDACEQLGIFITISGRQGGMAAEMFQSLI